MEKRYTLKIQVIDETDSKQECAIECNDLTLEEKKDMMKSLVPAITEWIEKDAD